MSEPNYLEAPTVPQVVATDGRQWQYLTPSKHFWRTQLFVMGSKVPASDVWQGMNTYNQTIEEAAETWNFPIAAIEEILEYCLANTELLAKEDAEELRLSKTWGVGTCAYS